MPTPSQPLVDAMQSATMFSPTTTLLFGLIMGIAIGVGAMLMFRRELKKEEEKPPV